MPEISGVVFRPGDSGPVSTVTVAKQIFAAALEKTDPALAASIGSEGDWRAAYARYGVPMMLAGLKSRDAVLSIARDGLRAAHAGVQFTRDGRTTPLAEVAPRPGFFETETLEGKGARVDHLRVPVGGRLLEGEELKREIHRWRTEHLAEQGCTDVLLSFLEDPAKLDLRGRTFVLLGAGAEVGPLRPLLEWGATVIAVDLDRPEVHERIETTVRSTAGRVVLPREGRRTAGANLLTELPEIMGWLAERGPVDVLGAYAYLDGEKHVRLTLAMDRIVTALSAAQPKAMVAYLMTPTEVFVVPQATAAVSRAAFQSRNLFARPLRALTRGRLFEENIRAEAAVDSVPHGIIDDVETRQGPNYILAKRLQRWRIFEAQAEGRRVSCNVAPMTRTRSVLSNRIYAAGYRGTKPLAIETFDAATTNTVMAALLVHDLQRDQSGSAHPETILRDRAFHGGLWSCPYQLRSVIEAGVAAGFFKRS